MSQARELHYYDGESGTYIGSHDSKQSATESVNGNLGDMHRAIINQTRYKGMYWSYRQGMNINEPDEEILEYNARLASQKQKFMDTNRIERKSFRESTRWFNAVDAFRSELEDNLETHGFSKLTVSHKADRDAPVGLIHLTDVHFNELINIKGNSYDFEVASKRIKEFITRSTIYLESFGCTNVVLAMGGDMMNSDRRLDELLNQASNRADAMWVAVDILQQAILDLNNKFNVTVTGVCGNESRGPQDIHWSKYVVTDNYDWTILRVLEKLFMGSDIDFIIPDDPLELLMDINGHRVLMLHGHQNKMQTEGGIQQIIGKYVSLDERVDFIIYGHVHCAKISDFHARGGGLPGANSYSDKSLQLPGRASQNLHIFFSDGTRDSIRLDLQVVPNEMYNINLEMERYNIKSSEKGKTHRTIFEIRI